MRELDAAQTAEYFKHDPDEAKKLAHSLAAGPTHTYGMIKKAFAANGIQFAFPTVTVAGGSVIVTNGVLSEITRVADIDENGNYVLETLYRGVEGADEDLFGKAWKTVTGEKPEAGS